MAESSSIANPICSSESSIENKPFDDDVGWECGSEHYKLLEKVGRGAFAEVFAAECSTGRRKGTGVAIKVIDLDGLSSNLEDIRQEVATLRLCNHKNVLRFYASFVEQRTRHELWLVTQLLAKGSCLHVISEAKKMGMPPGMHEDWLVWILRESLNGLRYFHEHQQIHRDIKAGNILLDKVGRVALADFGVSRWINGALNNGSNDGRAKTFVGTPCWMAPEVMEQLDGYDFKADIWSLGITALELAKGHAPYSSFPPMKVLLYTIQNEPPSLATYPDGKRDNIPFSRSFRDLVRMCLQKDPLKRPTCAKLLTHALFTQKEPTPLSLVNGLLNNIRDFGDVSSIPTNNEIKHKKSSNVEDVSNLDTTRAGGSAGSNTEIVYGAAGLEAAMDEQERESHQASYPIWSFNDSEIREALKEAGIKLPELNVNEQSSSSATSKLDNDSSKTTMMDEDTSLKSTAVDEPSDNVNGQNSPTGEGGGGGGDDEEEEEGGGNDSQYESKEGIRADQDAYVSAMGGALELMSEEEVNEDKTAMAAIESDGNDVVFAFINAIGNEFGGEFDHGEDDGNSPATRVGQVVNQDQNNLTDLNLNHPQNDSDNNDETETYEEEGNMNQEDREEGEYSTQGGEYMNQNNGGEGDYNQGAEYYNQEGEYVNQDNGEEGDYNQGGEYITHNNGEEGDYNQGAEYMNQSSVDEGEYSNQGGDTNETGYCKKCGFSLYHYAGKPCGSDPEGRKHPEWTQKPHPSFAEANR